jgi:hypothetical protein
MLAFIQISKPIPLTFAVIIEDYLLELQLGVLNLYDHQLTIG